MMSPLGLLVLGSLHMSQAHWEERQMAKVRTAGLPKPVWQVKGREFLLPQLRVLIRTD